MKSTFLTTGAGHVYKVGDDYQPDFLTIEVSAIRQRAGSIYALLTTSTTLPGARVIPGTERVLNAEVWLLSDRSRSEYASSLARLIPAPEGAEAIDFGLVLNEVAERVIERENTPFSVVRLNGQVRPVTTFLLEGIIPVRKPTILYGAGGSGKSILAAALAVAIQSGVRFLGKATRQAEVLYLDWETDEDDIGSRVQVAARGLGVTNPSLRYAPMVRPLEDRVATLARTVAEEDINLIIIDSVGMALGQSRDGDPSDTAIRFFRALRALDCAVLAIDHISGDDMRRSRAGAGKPYGSVYKWNSARNAFELRVTREPDASGSHLLLKHRKTNIGPFQRDLPLTLDWNDADGVVTFSVDNAPPAPVRVPLDEQIMDTLTVAPATPHQIADLLSDADMTYTEMEVRRVLKTLISDGKVRAGADGAVRVADTGQDGVDSPLDTGLS